MLLGQANRGAPPRTVSFEGIPKRLGRPNAVIEPFKVGAKKLTFPAYDRIATIGRSRAIALPLLVEIIPINSPGQRAKTALEEPAPRALQATTIHHKMVTVRFDGGVYHSINCGR
jgi:hypothetical protein